MIQLTELALIIIDLQFLVQPYKGNQLTVLVFHRELTLLCTFFSKRSTWVREMNPEGQIAKKSKFNDKILLLVRTPMNAKLGFR